MSHHAVVALAIVALRRSSMADTPERGESRDDERVHEAYQKLGQMGGEATAETHGRDFYQEIGVKGGETVKEKYGPEFYSEIGRKGGEAGGHKGGEARKEQMARGEITRDEDEDL
jgi:uncharacterized protein